MKIIVERFPQIKDMSAIREVTENVTKKQFDLMVKVDELLVAHKKFRAAATNRTANDAQRKQELSEVVKRSNRTISELQKDNAQLKEKYAQLKEKHAQVEEKLSAETEKVNQLNHKLSSLQEHFDKTVARGLTHVGSER